MKSQSSIEVLLPTEQDESARNLVSDDQTSKLNKQNSQSLTNFANTINQRIDTKESDIVIKEQQNQFQCEEPSESNLVQLSNVPSQKETNTQINDSQPECVDESFIPPTFEVPMYEEPIQKEDKQPEKTPTKEDQMKRIFELAKLQIKEKHDRNMKRALNNNKSPTPEKRKPSPFSNVRLQKMDANTTTPSKIRSKQDVEIKRSSQTKSRSPISSKKTDFKKIAQKTIIEDLYKKLQEREAEGRCKNCHVGEKRNRDLGMNSKSPVKSRETTEHDRKRTEETGEVTVRLKIVCSPLKENETKEVKKDLSTDDLLKTLKKVKKLIYKKPEDDTNLKKLQSYLK